MKVGCCAPSEFFVDAGEVSPERFVEFSAKMRDAGYDFLELAVGYTRPEEGEDGFAPLRAAAEISAVPIEAFNCFLAGSVKITGPEADQDRLTRYADTAIARMAAIGSKVVVLGSGAARHVPEGFPMRQAQEQFTWFLNACAEAASKCGMVVAIEPLNRGETNIINSLAEALEYVEWVGRPQVQALVDIYHMVLEDEPLEHILDAGPALVHVHVSETDRRHPGSGSYDYSTFISYLKKIGYEGRLSVECGWEDFWTQAPKAALFLRKAVKQWETLLDC